MNYVSSARSDWPFALGSNCPPFDALDCAERGFDKIRRPMAALLLAGFVIAGILSILIEGASAVRGDSLTFEQRAGVMTATDVGTLLFAGGDEALLEAFIADDASVPYPGGRLNGPEGVAQLSGFIAGGQGNRAFSLESAGVEGNTVVLNWRLEGPIAPGYLIWYLVPEGSAIAGELTLEVAGGEVVDLEMAVLS